MKNLILLFALILSGSTFAQTSNMETRGSVNGCQDGKRVARSSDWYTTLNSVMNNQSIDINYRVSYYEAFMSCRRNELQGEKTDSFLSEWFYEHNKPGHEHKFHPSVE